MGHAGGFEQREPPGLSVHLLILNGAAAAELLTVTATKFSGGGTIGAFPPGSGQALKVHGVDAQLFNGGPAKHLSWTERGVQYAVSAAASISDSEVVKLAESVVPAEGSSASFTATAPTG